MISHKTKYAQVGRYRFIPLDEFPEPRRSERRNERGNHRRIARRCSCEEGMESKPSRDVGPRYERLEEPLCDRRRLVMRRFARFFYKAVRVDRQVGCSGFGEVQEADEVNIPSPPPPLRAAFLKPFNVGWQSTISRWRDSSSTMTQRSTDDNSFQYSKSKVVHRSKSWRNWFTYGSIIHSNRYSISMSIWTLWTY